MVMSGCLSSCGVDCGIVMLLYAISKAFEIVLENVKGVSPGYREENSFSSSHSLSRSS